LRHDWLAVQGAAVEDSDIVAAAQRFARLTA